MPIDALQRVFYLAQWRAMTVSKFDKLNYTRESIQRTNSCEFNLRHLLNKVLLELNAEPQRWLPSSVENEFLEFLNKNDTLESPCAQNIYLLLVQKRFNRICRIITDDVLDFSTTSFSSEVELRSDGSYALRCSINNSNLMHQLIIPSEMRIKLYNLLKNVLYVLNKAGIKCWASSGTLLGAVRHGTIIPWDDDVDLAISVLDKDRLRKAFNYSYKKKFPNTTNDDDNNNNNNNFEEDDLILEYVPLFGYKVYSKSLPPPSRDVRNNFMSYGYFVDISIKTNTFL